MAYAVVFSWYYFTQNAWKFVKKNQLILFHQNHIAVNKTFSPYNNTWKDLFAWHFTFNEKSLIIV